MLNHKSQIRNPKQIPNPNVQIYLFVICCLFIGILFVCASVKEKAKGFAGISTKVLEEGRKSAITKKFNYDYNTCYSKVKAALKKMESYIYADDPKKNMLAIYVSEADTTPVGIFLKEINIGNTQIEVSSPSTYAKELISEKLFNLLVPESGKDTNESKPMGNK